MEDKDFRAGDPVCTWRLGDGVVSDLKSESEVYSVRVEFLSGRVVHFTPEGLLYLGAARPSLFHGTFEQVFGQVKDVKPVRNVIKYLNIFRDYAGLARWIMFDTEIAAKGHADFCLSNHYIAVAVPVEVDE